MKPRCVTCSAIADESVRAVKNAELREIAREMILEHVFKNWHGKHRRGKAKSKKLAALAPRKGKR